jgi:hypothetical protein
MRPSSLSRLGGFLHNSLIAIFQETHFLPLAAYLILWVSSRKLSRLWIEHFTTLYPFQSFPYSAPGIMSARLGRSNCLAPKRPNSNASCLKKMISKSCLAVYMLHIRGDLSSISSISASVIQYGPHVT